MVTRIAKPKVLLTCDIPEHIPEYQEFQKYFDVVVSNLFAGIPRENHTWKFHDVGTFFFFTFTNKTH